MVMELQSMEAMPENIQGCFTDTAYVGSGSTLGHSCLNHPAWKWHRLTVVGFSYTANYSFPPSLASTSFATFALIGDGPALRSTGVSALWHTGFSSQQGPSRPGLCPADFKTHTSQFPGSEVVKVGCQQSLRYPGSSNRPPAPLYL